MNQRAEIRPLAPPSRVVLVGFGAVGARLLGEVGRALGEVLGVTARAGPALELPRYAFNEVRGQYHATPIMRKLATLRPADATPVLGVIGHDLFVPDAPYVIGDADRGEGSALYSLARLGDPDKEKVVRRAQVEGVHAMGHLLGLSHCLDWRCAMFASRDAADSDRKGPGLCNSCRTAVGLP